MANILTFYNDYDFSNQTNASSILTITINNFDLRAYLSFRIILTWLSFFIIIVGLIGNFISFLILINKKMRISTNVFLASLCVSAFVALVGLLINSVIYELLAYYGLFKALNILYFFYPYIYPLITTFQMTSILLTVCVSVNQFICVYCLKAKIVPKKANKIECKKALIVVLVMFVLSIGYCIPYWLKFEYTLKNGLVVTELGNNPVFVKVIHLYMYLPAVYVIPFSILIITNTYLLSTIVIANRRRKRLLGMRKCEQEDDLLEKKIETILEGSPLRRSPKSKNTRSNVTLMLLAVVFFFFICQFPTLVLHILASMICSNELSKCSGSVYYQYCLAVSKFLLICNLSFNFVIYCLFSEKFRGVLRETLAFSNGKKNKDELTSRRASIL
jgi:hypothetical protein